MSPFDFPQYENELFYQYYDRLCAHVCSSQISCEVWELCCVIYTGMNDETWEIVRSLRNDGFCVSDYDHNMNLFKNLAYDTRPLELPSHSEYENPHLPKLNDNVSFDFDNEDDEGGMDLFDDEEDDRVLNCSHPTQIEYLSINYPCASLDITHFSENPLLDCDLDYDLQLKNSLSVIMDAKEVNETIRDIEFVFKHCESKINMSYACTSIVHVWFYMVSIHYNHFSCLFGSVFDKLLRALSCSDLDPCCCK